MTRPAMNLSSMASPTTSTWVRAMPVTRCAPGQARSAAASTGRCRKRQRDQHEEEHEELGVTEVVLEQSRGQHCRQRRQCRRGEHPFGAGGPPSRPAAHRRRPATICGTSETAPCHDGDEPSHTRSAGRPRSAAICSGTLCRWGWSGLRRIPAGIRSHHAGTMLGPTPVSGWSLTMSAPISIIANRSWFAGSCASNVEVRREMSP